MYLEINNTRYPCTGYAPGTQGVSFRGIEWLDLPVSGTVKLYNDDGFGFCVFDTRGYARQVYEGGILTFTNEPAPAVPTAEELLAQAKAAALARIDGKCSAAIMSGVTVGGKHYRLTQTAQGNIKGMLIEAQNGKTVFLYCADNEPLTTYTADEIKAIAQVMGE